MIKLARVSRIFLLLFAASFFTSTSQAVVIDVGDGSANTAATISASGTFANVFANVGSRGIGSGVYLGNGIVLTANHVGAGSIVLGGTTYNAEPGSELRLDAPGASTTLVDLKLFQIDTDPGLSALTIGSVTAGTAIRMVGDGFDRETTQTDWNASWNEVTPPPPAVFSGYKTLSTRSIRWGDNTVQSGAGPLAGNTLTLATDFDSGESQAVNHDSGGGVFAQNGSDWELVGIILAVGTFAGQPGGADTAVFGNATYFADLSQYVDQIDAYIAAVPTPGTLALLSIGSVTLLARRRRRTA